MTRGLGWADTRVAVDGWHGLRSGLGAGETASLRGGSITGCRWPCAPRRGNRKGVVEEGQPHRRATLVAHPGRRRDGRGGPSRCGPLRPGAGDSCLRATADGRLVAILAETEPLSPLPAVPYPVIVVKRVRPTRQAMVSYRGNRYSVPPELARAQVVVSHRSVGNSARCHRRRDRGGAASDGR